jgi:SAM-dependent methyltransferase/UDP-N-acetylglucosamine transferase subunit ALG13
MSPWPFDRLLDAIAPLCSRHRVFAQTGTARVRPPCSSSPFVPYTELLERIRRADVVITHAGNTVRLVQRAGKVPIAVARTAADGEMPNDHQVEFLQHEERGGRVVAVWNVETLPDAVEAHAAHEAQLLAERELPEPADGARVAAILDDLWSRVADNPFRLNALRRYAFAWEELCMRSGQHLDVGCATGDFVGVLAATTSLECHGVDPHEGYLRQLVCRFPEVHARRIGTSGPLPYPDATFDSVSLLDVLEHCPDEDALLGELRRVLRPGGLLVLTVPARHAFSWLDPDNAKFRAPRLHRAVYSLRFGHERYAERFVDCSNGLFGDMSVAKNVHTNYRPGWLVHQLEEHGLQVVRHSGANLFWRLLQTPAVLAGGRVRRWLERAIWLDGELFARANLFVSARKVS